ncbi:hypothetical protein Droror1_Dr00026316 [Drosera rotundifolia]
MTRTKSMNAESTEAVIVCLNEEVRRTARLILFTSLVYDPVSINEAISFKSIQIKIKSNHQQNNKGHKTPIPEQPNRAKPQKNQFTSHPIDPNPIIKTLKSKLKIDSPNSNSQ